MAMRIGQAIDLPTHHLDEIARVGGGTGPERSAEERAADIRRIVDSGRWVADGIHLGWTEPLFEAAELIVWLDHLSWRRSSVMIVKRFWRDARAEMRRQRGLRKFTRFSSFARRLSDLIRAVPETRAYHRGSSDSTGPTYAATYAALLPYREKLVWCRSKKEADRVIEAISRADHSVASQF
jgi:hypothetical protein